MTIRRITLTVTVKYDDTRIVNPGHLVGGMIDEMQSWGGSGEHYKVEVGEPEFDTLIDVARREALLLTGIQLDSAARNKDVANSADHVFEAVKRWCELAERTDIFPAYLELQREAMAMGHGQK